MAREWKPGERVAFLDEVGGGVVHALNKGRVVVRTDDGFDLEYAPDRLVPGGDARTVLGRITDHQLGMVAANDTRDEQRRRRHKGEPSRPGKTPKRGPEGDVAEVDLHLHEIIDDASGLGDGEKLEYQMRYFERALNAAIRDGKRKLIVIHGVGEGVLREEVRKALQFYAHVRFHDADMRRYGSGATEVEILRGR
ncbi:MAG: Smr/MutS family protein [Flavobacteriales bacterium]|jgi:hypothetical protein|nr:Smr/MutS family protein [Flavobacteriales bacterium]